MEVRVVLGRVIGLLDRQDQRHQRLGDIAPAIDAEMAARVRARRDRCSVSASSLLREDAPRRHGGHGEMRPRSVSSWHQSVRATAEIRGFCPGPCRRGGARRRRTHRPRSRRKSAPPRAAAPRSARPTASTAGASDARRSAASRTRGRCRPAARRRGAAASRRTAADRRSLRSARRPSTSSAAAIGIAFMTGRPKRALTSATRSGLSLPWNCRMSSGAAVKRRLDRGVVGIDEQPDPAHRRRAPRRTARRRAPATRSAGSADRRQSRDTPRRPRPRRRPLPRSTTRRSWRRRSCARYGPSPAAGEGGREAYIPR